MEAAWNMTAWPFAFLPLQPVDITQAVAERIKAQRRLAENPNDISAMCMLSRAQEQVLIQERFTVLQTVLETGPLKNERKI